VVKLGSAENEEEKEGLGRDFLRVFSQMEGMLAGQPRNLAT